MNPVDPASLGPSLFRAPLLHSVRRRCNSSLFNTVANTQRDTQRVQRSRTAQSELPSRKRTRQTKQQRRTQTARRHRTRQSRVIDNAVGLHLKLGLTPAFTVAYTETPKPAVYCCRLFYQTKGSCFSDASCFICF